MLLLHENINSIQPHLNMVAGSVSRACNYYHNPLFKFTVSFSGVFYIYILHWSMSSLTMLKQLYRVPSLSYSKLTS